MSSCDVVQSAGTEQGAISSIDIVQLEWNKASNIPDPDPDPLEGRAIVQNNTMDAYAGKVELTAKEIEYIETKPAEETDKWKSAEQTILVQKKKKET
ncbi:hypothetical protein CHS0354_036114 [Potamilus streckersoni]|uniref:Uncharacterized protein n=1 Tax=Potamilus streckersoni TaxID=2493646 RepID=A0AAE0T412_9BIVA|nr:hypothetical protein CHS0354_036114 [Potamilus streckersoni]